MVPAAPNRVVATPAPPPPRQHFTSYLRSTRIRELVVANAAATGQMRMIEPANEPLRAGFTSSPRHRDLNNLQRSRHQQNLPTLAYDLDKDGTVSQRDFYLASMFDKGHKRTLTAAESDQACGALASGIAAQPVQRFFNFNQARQPLNRFEKVLQRTVPMQKLGLGDTWARTMGDWTVRDQHQNWATTSSSVFSENSAYRPATTAHPPRQTWGSAGESETSPNVGQARRASTARSETRSPRSTGPAAGGWASNTRDLYSKTDWSTSGSDAAGKFSRHRVVPGTMSFRCQRRSAPVP